MREAARAVRNLDGVGMLGTVLADTLGRTPGYAKGTRAVRPAGESPVDPKIDIADTRRVVWSRLLLAFMRVPQAVLLAVGGGLAGWMLGHLLVGAIGPWITTNAGVTASIFSAAPLAEALLVPFLVVLAIVAALLPAIAAYRTDVAKWLQGPG
jgi:hypothetical protein